MALETRPQSVRRVQLAARAPRAALLVACAILCAVGLRTVMSGTQAPASVPPIRANATADTRMESVAEGFARAYLSWDERRPEARIAAIRMFAPAIARDDVDRYVRGPRGTQIVLWSAVAADDGEGSARRITVVAQTSSGFTALVVEVRRTATGRIVVADRPAIVGTPPVASAAPDSNQEPLDDDGLQATVTRALTNFLASDRGALAADLLPGSTVVLPAGGLELRAVNDIAWSVPRREVKASVTAALHGGGQLDLTYSVGVVRQAGRWFVSWIGARESTSGRSA